MVFAKHLLVCAGLGLFWANAASAVTISDFAAPSSAVTDDVGGGSTTDGGLGTAGGMFDTQTLTATSAGTGSVTIRTSLMFLEFNPGFGTLGTGEALFSGGGPIDLSATTAFVIDFMGADFIGGDIFLQVFDSSTDSGLLDFTGGGTLGTAPTTLSILAGAVTGAGVNLSDVTALRLFVDSGATAGNDLAFDSFRTTDIPAVPEPTTLVLFGLGLSVLGLRRKRLR